MLSNPSIQNVQIAAGQWTTPLVATDMGIAPGWGVQDICMALISLECTVGAANIDGLGT